MPRERSVGPDAGLELGARKRRQAGILAVLKDKERPIGVTVLGTLVIALGVCSWVEGIAGCIGVWGRGLRLDPTLLFPWAGYGLLRLSQGWRWFLLAVCWLIVALGSIASLLVVIGERLQLGGMTVPAGWQLGLGLASVLGMAFACIHYLGSREVLVAFGLPTESGRRAARVVCIALSICLPLVLASTMAVSSRGADLSQLRARIEHLYPAQLEYLRDHRGVSPSGAAAQLFEAPGILGAGWQTSERTRHWFKLQIDDESESTIGAMGWGSGVVSGVTAHFVTYRGSPPREPGILLTVDRRFLEE